MTPHPLMTRKEIAHALTVSVWYVLRNEVALGIRTARVDLGRRTVRYDRTKVREALRPRGILII